MIPPGATIGIVGGGQLGRMLAIAAAELGYRTHVFCPEAECPAAEVASAHSVAAYDDVEALARFAEAVDVVTFEFENIPSEGLKAIAPLVPVRPSPDVLDVCRHRLREKEFINSLGIGTAPFRAVRDEAELKSAVEALGLPAILKTCTMGYDGKGQWKFNTVEEVDGGWWMVNGKKSPPTTNHHSPSTPFILEGFVDFSMEISVIVARAPSGEMACYPAVENIHRDHILHETIAPARIPPLLAAEAEAIARRIAEGVKLEGVLAVEMFVTPGGLLVNELAPRPHNSGHWTIDACAVSQFAQAVRAVCDVPLGDTAPLCGAVMTNLIGEEANGWEEWLKNPRACLHLYGKAEARPGRKMGHVTVLS